MNNQLLASQGQQGQIASLTSQANGTGGPNLGQTQLNNATNQNLQTTAGQIGSLQGINPAAQARLISQNQSNIQQQSAGQSAVERQNQQLAAQQQLQQALASNFAGNQGLLQGAQAGNQQNLNNYQFAEDLNQKTGAENTGAATASAGQQAQLAASQDPLAFLGNILGGAANGGGGALTKWALGPSTPAVPGAAHGALVGGPKTPPGVDGTPAMLRRGEVVVPEEIVKMGPMAVASFTSRLLRLKGKR